jgi:hypothetical protein
MAIDETRFVKLIKQFGKMDSSENLNGIIEFSNYSQRDVDRIKQETGARTDNEVYCEIEKNLNDENLIKEEEENGQEL